MSDVATLQPEAASIIACTISRDVGNFDLLVEDMETELGENWGDLTFEDAAVFLTQPDADSLEFLAIAIDSEDEDDLEQVCTVITTAKAKGIRIILVAEDVSPVALHQLLKLSGADFVPYPLPENALRESINRLRNEPDPAEMLPESAAPPSFKPKGDRDGVILQDEGKRGLFLPHVWSSLPEPALRRRPTNSDPSAGDTDFPFLSDGSSPADWSVP